MLSFGLKSSLQNNFPKRLFSGKVPFAKLNHKWNSEIETELENFPSRIAIPVQWGEQDTFRHLNNVNWLRFIETAGNEFDDFVQGKGKGFVVKSQECKYKLPVTYPDILTLATKIENLSRDRFTFHTKAYSHKWDKLAGEATVLCVGYDHEKLGKTDFSESFIKGIVSIESNPMKAHQLYQKLRI